MCYRKRRIKNPVKDEHRTGFDKEYIKAACCSCPSCRRVKSNDWLVRSYFEFLDNPRPAFFCSLDFDNEHLPTYNGMPCFDSEIMKHFLYRLRYYVGTFRYLYATDYGGFLKRSHYHIVVVPDDMSQTATTFFAAVQKAWQCGHHGNVLSLSSVNGDHTKAIDYVCGYVNKDVTFQLDDKHKDMPPRFRPRIQASKGFGLQALETGRIDFDKLINDGYVSIPLGSNGTNLRFPIPRYYEMKLTYDYHYNKDTRKCELVKNQYGVELAKSRHNAHYSYFIRSFFSSRHFYMPSVNIDLSYFGTQSWYEVVTSCLTDFEDFKEFVYYRPFIYFQGESLIIDSVRREHLYRPSWKYYEMACQIYEQYKSYFDSVKCEVETERLIESAKSRARKRLQNDPQLRKYLVRKNYDFSLLN